MEENELLRKSERLKLVWYNNLGVLFELIHDLKSKEGVFMLPEGGNKTVRCLKVNKVDYLKSNMREWGFFKNNFNMYSSLGHFPDMPMASWNRAKYQIQKAEFSKNHLSLMKGYDFMIDLDQQDDEKNIKECYKSAKRVKKILDNFKIKYYIIFSGQKGFHFRIDYEDYPNWMKKLDMLELIRILKSLTEKLQLIENIKHIDEDLIDSRRITKLPYSVVIPKEEYDEVHNFKVALPLSDEDFDNFKIENYLLTECLTKIDTYKRRGLLKRNGDPENFTLLLEDFEVK